VLYSINIDRDLPTTTTKMDISVKCLGLIRGHLPSGIVSNRSSLYREYLHDFVAEMVDDLHGDAARPARDPRSWPRTAGPFHAPLFFVRSGSLLEFLEPDRQPVSIRAIQTSPRQLDHLPSDPL